MCLESRGEKRGRLAHTNEHIHTHTLLGQFWIQRTSNDNLTRIHRGDGSLPDHVRRITSNLQWRTLRSSKYGKREDMYVAFLIVLLLIICRGEFYDPLAMENMKICMWPSQL